MRLWVTLVADKPKALQLLSEVYFGYIKQPDGPILLVTKE